MKKQPKLARPYVWPTFAEIEANSETIDASKDPVELALRRKLAKESDDNLAERTRI